MPGRKGDIPDKRLTFHVCHPNYSYIPGYVDAMQEIFESLAKHPLKIIGEFLIPTAIRLMQAHSAMGPEEGNERGPMDTQAFGREIAEKYGLQTFISGKFKQYPDYNFRSYGDSFKAIYGEQSIPDFFRAFSYPDQEGKEPLGLMWVGSGEKALAYQKTLSPTRQRVTQNSLEKYVVHTELDQALFFIHPAYSKEEYERYQQALLKPIEDIQANKDVKENVTKIYWLLAQGTPVERGGSALANLILQISCT